MLHRARPGSLPGWGAAGRGGPIGPNRLTVLLHLMSGDEGGVRRPMGKPRWGAGFGREDRLVLTCRDVIMDLLLDYLDQALTGELAAELEDHLKICAPCRAYIETYKRTRDL